MESKLKKEMELDMQDSLVEQLRCSLCTKYLSCAPIQLLSDGTSICGRCSSSTVEEPTTRQLTLELILNSTLFPCEFRVNGCEERLLFGHFSEHETNCAYRTVSCPSLPDGDCSWKGEILKIPDHIAENHPDVKKSLDFNLELKDDKQEISMAVIQDVTFIAKYAYNSSTSSLYYDIRYFMGNVQSVSYKLPLFNVLDENCSITKDQTCVPFSTDFYDIQASKAFTLTDQLKILNEPETIAVTVALTIKHLTVDSDDDLKCTNCLQYLIPPIFEDPSSGAICYDCYHHDHHCYVAPINMADLKQRVATANYPCRWEGCNFIDKSCNIRKHEKNCKFYQQVCLICREFVKLHEIITHLNDHGCQSISGNVISFPHKLSLSKSNSKVFCILRLPRVISVYFATYENMPRLILVEQDPMPYFHWPSIKCELLLKNTQNKIKSQTFIFRRYKEFKMTVNNLPDDCKPDEELTATLKLLEEVEA